MPTHACGAPLERDAILLAAGVVTRVERDSGGTVLWSRSGTVRCRVGCQASGSLRSALSSGAVASELCADNICGILVC